MIRTKYNRDTTVRALGYSRHVIVELQLYSACCAQKTLTEPTSCTQFILFCRIYIIVQSLCSLHELTVNIFRHSIFNERKQCERCTHSVMSFITMSTFVLDKVRLSITDHYYMLQHTIIQGLWMWQQWCVCVNWSTRAYPGPYYFLEHYLAACLD